MVKVRCPKILFTHPFELCVSFCTMLVAIQEIARGRVLSTVADSTLYTTLVWSWQIGIIIGATFMALGLIVRGQAHGTPRRIFWQGVERSGLYFTAASTLTYVIVLATRARGSGYAIAIFLSIGLACVFRALAIRREARQTIEAITKLADGAQ